ncbi:MAG TPA: class I mannose-6-phosphate isomerase [Candidatus Olsenella avicola]|uniref:type I phosphomannose isomerase catalytic subunit n=1 Tax=Olsenella sp. An285 TaxID=1965621 RepID=UPI000B36B9C9|nr:type I phosphomannose isomerase catalytic subunit [Olsenella sp. An285]OUO47282.1 mannose-6-phosphate isomerase [Olsenella sp. An285]HIY51490.1 class I mannose-6-phosphate isomerase [Candidatus Olsenella avicola]
MPDTSRDLIFPAPIFHEKIWGGRKLATDFGYEIPDGPIGECWAISAHPNGDCVVSGGAWDGMHLSELWDQHRELFGNVEGDRFPLLVKIIDAKDHLSVQVHPDDAYAAEHENGSLGKRECWYVLAVDPGTKIVIGQRAHDRAELAQMIEEGRWDDMLNLVPCHVGDFFPIEPGTVHAIQGGTLILETQQSSDVTYRVYDYDRVQDDGSTRELHIQQSLDVVDYGMEAPASGEVTAPEVDGVTELMECPNFVVDRVRVSGEKNVEQEWPFLCVSVIEGSGTVSASEAGVTHEIARGTHFLAPAGCGTMAFAGDMTLVTSRLP